jgi:hypothetical protein
MQPLEYELSFQILHGKESGVERHSDLVEDCESQHEWPS